MHYLTTRLPNPSQICDALYNLHPDNASSAVKMVYAEGILVGLVSGLMAAGLSFEDSLIAIRDASYGGIPVMQQCLPGSWVKDWVRLGVAPFAS